MIYPSSIKTETLLGPHSFGDKMSRRSFNSRRKRSGFRWNVAGMNYGAKRESEDGGRGTLQE